MNSTLELNSSKSPVRELSVASEKDDNRTIRFAAEHDLLLPKSTKPTETSPIDEFCESLGNLDQTLAKGKKPI
jgi:hypothetical protein